MIEHFARLDRGAPRRGLGRFTVNQSAAAGPPVCAHAYHSGYIGFADLLNQLREQISQLGIRLSFDGIWQRAVNGVGGDLSQMRILYSLHFFQYLGANAMQANNFSADSILIQL